MSNLEYTECKYFSRNCSERTRNPRKTFQQIIYACLLTFRRIINHSFTVGFHGFKDNTMTTEKLSRSLAGSDHMATMSVKIEIRTNILRRRTLTY